MRIKKHKFIAAQIFVVLLFSFVSLQSQTLNAVDDTIDLYPGIPKTVNLLENDMIPTGDSLKIIGGYSSGIVEITITYHYKGFYTYLAKQNLQSRYPFPHP